MGYPHEFIQFIEEICNLIECIFNLIQKEPVKFKGSEENFQKILKVIEILKTA